MMKKPSGLCLGKNYLGMPEPSLGELECVTRSNHVCPITVVSTARDSQTFFPTFWMDFYKVWELEM